MSSDQGHGDFTEQGGQRQYTKPHSGRHPIPTVQSYRHQRKEIRGQAEETEKAQHGPEDDRKTKRAFESAKAIFKGEDDSKGSGYDPYKSVNRNYANREATKENAD